MKKLLTVSILLLVASTVAMSQWQERRVYSPYRALRYVDNTFGINGFTIDGQGKLWIAPLEAVDTLSPPGKQRRQIIVLHPDGTPASFSPIRTLTIGVTIDSLAQNSYGLSRDHEGNILFCTFNDLYRINQQTGAAMNFFADVQSSSIGAVGVDAAGDIFANRVVGSATPIKILDKDFVLLPSNAVDTNRTIARKITVSADGTRLYVPNIYGTKQVVVYGNDLGPGFGLYTPVDTILVGMQVESMAWQPRPGNPPLLWASAGSRENPPDSMYRESVWYGLNLSTNTIVDSIDWGVTFPANPVWDDTVANAQRRRCRGIEFTSTGDTAYVAMFLRDSNSVKMFTKLPTSVDPVSNLVPDGYALSQNYPNPFNPTTEIEFSIPTAGFTTLKVYDLLGREVATLVSENLSPGTFRTRLDGSRFASGTYVYRLVSSATQITRKMLLLK